jgi:hypothetical protein
VSSTARSGTAVLGSVFCSIAGGDHPISYLKCKTWPEQLAGSLNCYDLDGFRVFGEQRQGNLSPVIRAKTGEHKVDVAAIRRKK